MFRFRDITPMAEPTARLRIAARRLPSAHRQDYLDEWRGELESILTGTGRLPATALWRGLRYAVGMLGAVESVRRTLVATPSDPLTRLWHVIRWPEHPTPRYTFIRNVITMLSALAAICAIYTVLAFALAAWIGGPDQAVIRGLIMAGEGILGSLINRIVMRIVKKRLPDSTAFDRGQQAWDELKLLIHRSLFGDLEYWSIQPPPIISSRAPRPPRPRQRSGRRRR